MLGLHLKQRDEQAAAEEQLSIFYNYSADKLVGNDEDTTVTFELDWSSELPHKVADDLEVEKVPDPDHIDPLNLMGGAMVAPPMAFQTSLIQTSPNGRSSAQKSPVSSSPLQKSHILNSPVQANSVQHEEQQDEDMMAAAIPLISILQKKQEEGEEGGQSQTIRADLIQVSSF